MSTTDTPPPEFDHVADVGAQRLARVYAEALLGVADQAGQTSAVVADIDSLLDDVLRHHPQLAALLAGAAVGRTARRAALAKAFAGRADTVLYKFLMVLNEHERLDLLPAIRRALHDIDDERHGRVRVEVVSAIPLPPDYAARLTDALRQHFGFEPVLVAHVDPAVLGGLRLRIGDRQFDATVRSRLDNLRNEVIARSSYEIQSRRDHFRTG